jgi:hypothetical protein
LNGALAAVEQPGTWWSDGIGDVAFLDTIAGETMLVSGYFNNEQAAYRHERPRDRPAERRRAHAPLGDGRRIR